MTTRLDKVTWKGVTSTSFLVREAFKSLSSGATTLFQSKGSWVPCVPTKAVFFTWEAAWGKVLTLDKLQRRGWHLPNKCFLCGCAKETVHHLLLHCSVVSPLWDIIFSLFGISWVFPKTVKETLLNWKGSFVGKKGSMIWKLIPLCIFLTVWKERNRIAFKNGSLAIQRLKHSFVSTLWGWNSLYIGEETSSLKGFLEWLASI